MIRKNENCKKRIVAGAAAVLAVALTACAGRTADRPDPPASPSPTVDTGFVLTGPDSYDSADTTILVGRNESEGTVTFLNLDLGRRYTLSLDGTTRLYDKYGDILSIEQFRTGDIVDITFLRSKKHLTTMQLSPQAWSYEDVERYEMNTVRGEVTVGSQVYKLTSNTRYLSDGREIESMDLNSADVLSFQGIDNQILTVRVEKGHGYLRLENDENFVGGWIEVGQTQIQRITEDMLMLVPEGSYDVSISHRGGGGIKKVIINRNEETLLDIGDLEIPEPQYGTVLFSLSPSSAELYIDGSAADPSGPISLEYGLHQLIVRAEGYQSVTQYIRVGEESAGINIELDANDAGATPEPTEEPAEGSDDQPTATDYYKIYIDGPEGVEVYLDGNYMGISPCDFEKKPGTHVITLRKTGHTTRSYTIEVDSEEKDISYSFADLTEDSPDAESDTSDVMDEILDILN